MTRTRTRAKGTSKGRFYATFRVLFYCDKQGRLWEISNHMTADKWHLYRTPRRVETLPAYDATLVKGTVAFMAGQSNGVELHQLIDTLDGV